MQEKYRSDQENSFKPGFSTFQLCDLGSTALCSSHKSIYALVPITGGSYNIN